MRDEIRPLEDRLRRLREKRDKKAIQLANKNLSERMIGANAGLSGPYINQLKKREDEKVVK